MKRKTKAKITKVMVIEDLFEVDTVDDGGASRTACITDGSDSCLFIRIQSWDELNRHEEFRELEGKRVRVTIEVIENGD